MLATYLWYKPDLSELQTWPWGMKGSIYSSDMYFGSQPFTANMRGKKVSLEEAFVWRWAALGTGKTGSLTKVSSVTWPHLFDAASCNTHQSQDCAGARAFPTVHTELNYSCWDLLAEQVKGDYLSLVPNGGGSKMPHCHWGLTVWRQGEHAISNRDLDFPKHCCYQQRPPPEPQPNSRLNTNSLPIIQVYVGIMNPKAAKISVIYLSSDITPYCTHQGA